MASSEEDKLYQDVLLKHAKDPVCYSEMPGADRVGRGFNKLCGDQVTIYLKIEDDCITQLSFSGESCAICKGSSSLLMEQIKGMHLTEVTSLLDRLQRFSSDWQLTDSSLDAFSPLQAVRNFPTRLKCLRLPWLALAAALEQNNESVTTE